MRISFIICPFWHTEAPPLGIGYLSAYLKSKGYETFSFDFNIDLYSKKKEHLMIGWDFHLPDNKRKAIFNDYFFKTDYYLNKQINRWMKKVLATNSEVICFSIYHENIHLSLDLAKRIKKQDYSKKIIFGGSYCRRNKNFYKDLGLFDVVDMVVVGEGEETLSEILKLYGRKRYLKLCKGVISKEGDGGIRNSIKNLDKLPFPDFSNFPLKYYTKKDRVYFLSTRGCIGQCSFCRDRNMWPKFTSRSADNIFKEMKLRRKQGYTFLRFSDLIINGNLKNLNRLCDLIIKNNLTIEWDGALKSNPMMNFSFFMKLKKAGYCGGNFSVESGSQNILNKMRKGHKIEFLEKNLRDMYHAGIGASVNIIVGFPGETDETIKQTLGFTHRNKKYILSLASLTPLYVLPESDLFKDYNKYNIKLGTNIENWTSLDGQNTYEWRLEKCQQIYEYVQSLGIKTFCDQYKKDINSYNLNKK